jgi:hypothetical protein
VAREGVQGGLNHGHRCLRGFLDDG